MRSPGGASCSRRCIPAPCPGLVLGDAPQPAVAGVGSIRSSLAERDGAGGDARLVPADSDARTGRHAVVDDERLVVAEIAVRETVHESIGKRVQLVRGARLRNARVAPAGFRVRRHRDADRARERAVRRGRPVHVELPRGKARRRGAKRHDVVRRAGRRQPGPVKIRRRRPPYVVAGGVALLRSSQSGQHLRPVVSAHPGACKRRAAG